jgi:hypothetical protein
MNKYTKQELVNAPFHSLTMGDLRRFVNNNPQIKDDVKVLCQRVEDNYFNESIFRGNEVDGWKVLLVNNDMFFGAESVDEEKDQFFPSFCISNNEDDSLIYIYNHY